MPSYEPYRYSNFETTLRLFGTAVAKEWKVPRSRNYWRWINKIGTAVIPETAWAIYSRAEQDNILRNIRELTAQVPRKRLSRAEWEGEAGKREWETRLRSWLPQGQMQVPQLPTAIIATLSTLTLQAMDIRSDNEPDGPRILQRHKTALLDDLTTRWPAWTDSQRAAADRIVHLYTEKVIAKQHRKIVAEPEYSNLIQFCVPPGPLVAALIPFMSILHYPQHHPQEEIALVETHIILLLVPLSKRWEGWTPPRRGLVLDLVRRHARGLEERWVQTPESVQPLTIKDSLPHIEEINTAIIAEAHDPVRGSASSAHSLAHIGYRSALHHGTSRARWEAQWI